MIIGLVIFCLCISFLAFVPLGSEANAQAWGLTMNSGHFFAFAALVWIGHNVMLRHKNSHPVMWGGLLCFALIVAIELLQPFFGRMASLADALIGAAGVITVLFWLLLRKGMALSRYGFAYGLFMAAISVLVVSPAVLEWTAVILRHQNLPVLGSYESSVEMKHWQASGSPRLGSTHVQRVNKNISEGAFSLRVDTSKGVWSGVRYLAGDENWGRYSQLMLDVYNPADEFKLNVRLDDRHSPGYNERYNGGFLVKKGWNNLAIDFKDIGSSVKSGDFDLVAIRKMILFVGKQEEPRTFYLDNVRLN